MGNYSVILRNGKQVKEIYIRAGNYDKAVGTANEKAAELTQETGDHWKVGRCDSH